MKIDAKVKDPGILNKKSKRAETNPIATILNALGWIGIIVSAIGGMRMAFSGFENAGSGFLIAGIVSSLIIIGFSEIIRLLHNIHLNTKGKQDWKFPDHAE